MGIEGYYEDYFDERQEKEKLTNFQRIKSMSLNEMAELFFDMTFNDFCCNKGCTSPLNCEGNMNECTEGIKQWLQEESEEQQ